MRHIKLPPTITRVLKEAFKRGGVLVKRGGVNWAATINLEALGVLKVVYPTTGRDANWPETHCWVLPTEHKDNHTMPSKRKPI